MISAVKTKSENNIDPYECKWKPDPNWWDIEKILEEDEEDYPAKLIVLVDDSTNSVECYGASKYKTNEGTIYTPTSISKFQTIDFIGNNDKQSTLYYKTRYIIYYFNEVEVTSPLRFPTNSIYIIIDKAILKNTSASLSSTSSVTEGAYGLFRNLTYLESFKFKNGAKILDNTTITDFCSGCKSLRKVLQSDMFDTSNFTQTGNNMFENCRALEYLEIDLSSSNSSQLLVNGKSLKYLKVKFNPNVKVSSHFRYAYENRNGIKVESNQISFSTNSSYNYPITEIILNNFDSEYTFQSSSRVYAEQLEILKNESKQGIVKMKTFPTVASLKRIEGNIKILDNIDLAECYEFEDWNNLINCLDDTSKKTLILGIINRYKLSEEQRDTIIAKGWTIA